MDAPTVEATDEFGNDVTAVVDTQNAPFEDRVDALMAKIAEDPTVRDRMMCELYIFISDFDTFTRTMAANGGPMAMLKMVMGR